MNNISNMETIAEVTIVPIEKPNEQLVLSQTLVADYEVKTLKEMHGIIADTITNIIRESSSSARNLKIGLKSYSASSSILFDITLSWKSEGPVQATVTAIAATGAAIASTKILEIIIKNPRGLALALAFALISCGVGYAIGKLADNTWDAQEEKFAQAKRKISDSENEILINFNVPTYEFSTDINIEDEINHVNDFFRFLDEADKKAGTSTSIDKLSLEYKMSNGAFTYEIVKGDTIWDLCNKYGLTYEEIIELNPWLEDRFSDDMEFALIRPGETLVLPQPKGQSIGVDKRFDLADRENRRPVDPLIFDLDYDGKIELTDVEGGRYFDIDNDGLAQKVAWIKEGSALLVLDKNGNGTIDNGLELFGDNTLLSDGKYAASGMEALAELDTNKDGKITSFDSKFNELKLLLADDTTVSLTEAGIKEIRLGYRNVDISDAGGNRQVKRAVFVTNDDIEHMYGEFMLNQNKYDSVSADVLEVPDGISKLPNVGGFGLVHSLHQAMVRDESKDLAALVQSFTDEEDIKVKHQIAEDIVYKWAGVENVSSEGRGLFDGKKLAVIEKFAGRFFCNNAKSTVINNNAVKTLNDIFTRIVGYFYSSAAIQTHMSDLFSKIVFEYRNDKWGVNLDKTFETIKKIIGDDESQSKDYSLNMVSDFGYVLKFFNYTDGINLSEYTRNFEYRFKSDYTASFLKYLIGWVGTVNKDTMDGNNDANFMYGREGDDTIKGYGGNDTIFGGEGNDHIYGDGGVDILDGGEGDDWIEGGMDNDTYYISSGKDYLYDTQGDDTYIIDPSILKAPSTSTINEMRGIDKLIFVNVKSDEINVKSNSSGQIFFSFKNYPGIEIMIISQLNSDRRIETYEFSDKTMNFSEIVNTFLCYQDGTDSDDNYTIPVFARQTHGLKGNDTINGDNNANILYGDEGDDTIKGYGGNDTIFGGEGNDHIYGDDGNDTIYGGEGKDWINGGNGDDVMDGGEGDDTVQSSYGNNTFYLSPGNDKIQSGGNNSNDTYIFDINRMTEASNNQINDFGGEDKLVFAGINSDEIKVKRNTNGWFSITFNNYPEHSITLVLQSNSTHKIESFVFDDKTMTFNEILQVCS